ncbi:dihydroorotate dehydrogenase electron transfer subunit [bacterium]|nr:dihydroorotate dehydrogenase electron transfer subunit [bacterium]
MFHNQILIVDNKEIAAGYFVMELISSQIAQNSFPGQFLHIKCSSDSQPLLRRPLSIHRVTSKKTIEILYKVVGKGTYFLSKRKKGEQIDCLGPLGNGFRLPEDQRPKTKDQRLIVAGGIGIAPLFFLTEKIKGLPIKVFIGAKTKDEILCAKELKKLGVKIHIATEDGSLGYKGLVSDLLKNNLLSDVCSLSSVIYACGPKAMLKEIALISKKHQIPCQVSFEQFMGCGIGICNACVIKTKQGYKRVCKDGPVFSAEEIDWK